LPGALCVVFDMRRYAPGRSHRGFCACWLRRRNEPYMGQGGHPRWAYACKPIAARRTLFSRVTWIRSGSCLNVNTYDIGRARPRHPDLPATGTLPKTESSPPATAACRSFHVHGCGPTTRRQGPPGSSSAPRPKPTKPLGAPGSFVLRIIGCARIARGAPTPQPPVREGGLIRGDLRLGIRSRREVYRDGATSPLSQPSSFGSARDSRRLPKDGVVASAAPRNFLERGPGDEKPPAGNRSPRLGRYQLSRAAQKPRRPAIIAKTFGGSLGNQIDIRRTTGREEGRRG